MRISSPLIVVAVLAWAPNAFAQQLPPDVRPNHWAAASVKSVLANKTMALVGGKEFRGDARVTRTELVIAIASLAQSVEGKKWKASKSVPIPKQAEKVGDESAWRKQPVTRYALAKILARAGDYLSNSIQRAAPNSPNAGKSKVMPRPSSSFPPANHPAYNAIKYLASKRMLGNPSPLLYPNDNPASADDVAIGLSQMMAGLNDILTELGKEADGTTPDRTFQKKKP